MRNRYNDQFLTLATLDNTINAYSGSTTNDTPTPSAYTSQYGTSTSMKSDQTHRDQSFFYLFSTLLTFGILVTLWFAHTNMRLKHDLPYYGNFSFAMPESLYSIWLPVAVILALFALMLRRKEINYVEIPKENSSPKTVDVENSFGNVLMRKSIEELTERLAEQNDKIEAHLAYLLSEINSVRINNAF